jgi:hypothetical protein
MPIRKVEALDYRARRSVAPPERIGEYAHRRLSAPDQRGRDERQA